MNPSDPKQLTEDEVEIIELLGDATMGDVNESKRAFAELLRRGKNVIAGTEAAERLIEILDPPRAVFVNKDVAFIDYAALANDGFSAHNSFGGFSQTSLVLSQSRVAPDHRCGFAAFAAS